MLKSNRSLTVAIVLNFQLILPACTGRANRNINVAPQQCKTGEILAPNGTSCVSAKPNRSGDTKGDINDPFDKDPPPSGQYNYPANEDKPKLDGTDTDPNASGTPDDNGQNNLGPIDSPTGAGPVTNDSGPDTTNPFDTGGANPNTPNSPVNPFDIGNPPNSGGGPGGPDLTGGNQPEPDNGSVSGDNGIISNTASGDPNDTSGDSRLSGTPDGPKVSLRLEAASANYKIRFASTEGITEARYEASAEFNKFTKTDIATSTSTQIAISTEAPTITVRFKLEKNGSQKDCAVEFKSLTPGRDDERQPLCTDKK